MKRYILVSGILLFILASCASYTVSTGLENIHMPEETIQQPTKLSEIQRQDSSCKEN